MDVLLLNQFIPVDPIRLMQVDFQQVLGGFYALAGTEENALSRKSEKK